jgi:hypothetical protein
MVRFTPHQTIKKEDTIMWRESELSGYKFWIKVYSESSDFGVRNGKISKLTIRKVGSTKDLCLYDRGWSVEPQGEVVAIFEEILRLYN